MNKKRKFLFECSKEGVVDDVISSFYFVSCCPFNPCFFSQTVLNSYAKASFVQQTVLLIKMRWSSNLKIRIPFMRIAYEVN